MGFAAGNGVQVPVDFIAREEHVDAAGRLWTRDLTTGCQYVYLQGRQDRPVERTESAHRGTFLDYAADGSLIGIEFI